MCEDEDKEYGWRFLFVGTRSVEANEKDVAFNKWYNSVVNRKEKKKQNRWLFWRILGIDNKKEMPVEISVCLKCFIMRPYFFKYLCGGLRYIHTGVKCYPSSRWSIYLLLIE